MENNDDDALPDIPEGQEPREEGEEEEEEGGEPPQQEADLGENPFAQLMEDNEGGQERFMEFFMTMLQRSANEKDVKKKVERKLVSDLVVMTRDRRAELYQLEIDSMPFHIGPHVWGLILSFLPSKDFSHCSQTCWFLRQVADVDNMWEQMFNREIGGVSIIAKRCTSWRQRFFLAQPVEDVVAAFVSVEEGDEIILW
jgi:hypothetical protein